MAYLAVNGNKVLDSSNYTEYCTPSNIGASATGHTHNYLPLSGGTLTGNISITGNNSFTFGPNSSWGQYLIVGGNGHVTSDHATVASTNGNLHIDAKSDHKVYLNWYTGNGVMVGYGDGSSTLAEINTTGMYYKGTAVSLSGHTHSSITDAGNGNTTTMAYSKAGLGYGDYTWLAAWNGYELRAIHKSQFAQASHTHDYLPSSGGHISGAVTMGPLAIATNYTDCWSDGTNRHPWYGYDHRYGNTGEYSTTISDYFGMSIKTASGLHKFFSNGTTQFSGQVQGSTFKATSDRNLKENIIKVTSIDLSPVSAYTYNFKNDCDKEKKVGLIAQEVQDVLPEAVSANSEGNLMIDYNAVVAALVANSNEMKAEIEQLRNEVAQLKNTISNMAK